MRSAGSWLLSISAASYANVESFLTDLTLDAPDATSEEAAAAHRAEDISFSRGSIRPRDRSGRRCSYSMRSTAASPPISPPQKARRSRGAPPALCRIEARHAPARHPRLVPQRFYVHQQFRRVDSHLYASRTRFLPDTLLGLFEQGTWLMRAAEPGRAVAGGPETRVDIAARLAVDSGDERQSIDGRTESGLIDLTAREQTWEVHSLRRKIAERGDAAGGDRGNPRSVTRKAGSVYRRRLRGSTRERSSPGDRLQVLTENLDARPHAKPLHRR
jgi:hypothetical protein